LLEMHQNTTRERHTHETEPTHSLPLHADVVCRYSAVRCECVQPPTASQLERVVKELTSAVARDAVLPSFQNAVTAAALRAMGALLLGMHAVCPLPKLPGRHHRTNVDRLKPKAPTETGVGLEAAAEGKKEKEAAVDGVDEMDMEVARPTTPPKHADDVRVHPAEGLRALLSTLLPRHAQPHNFLAVRLAALSVTARLEQVGVPPTLKHLCPSPERMAFGFVLCSPRPPTHALDAS
jgi:hypothetical protein